MKTLLISTGIGVLAGVIDILPMLVQKLPKRAIISAFLQYSFLSIIIVNINLPGIVWWLQGSIISLALATPIIVIVSENDNKVIPIIATMAVILGALIGIAGHILT
jgi:hypothetical protein